MLIISIAKLIWAFVASFAGLGAALYFVLKETLKSYFQERLERAKHELQDELQKKSIVYEHQKDSFRKLLGAMHKVMRQIEGNVEGDGGGWGPIPRKSYDSLKQTFSEERLFIDSRTDRVLDLFLHITWDAVGDEQFGNRPESEDVQWAFSQLELVWARTGEHFRKQVGLEPEMAEPLLDVDLLGGCRLINRYNFAQFALPTRSELSFGKYEGAEGLVSVARKNLVVLKSELNVLRQAALSRVDGAQFYHSLIAEIDRYLGVLKAMKT